jgi:hypothetical protein
MVWCQGSHLDRSACIASIAQTCQVPTQGGKFRAYCASTRPCHGTCVCHKMCRFTSSERSSFQTTPRTMCCRTACSSAGTKTVWAVVFDVPTGRHFGLQLRGPQASFKSSTKTKHSSSSTDYKAFFLPHALQSILPPARTTKNSSSSMHYKTFFLQHALQSILPPACTTTHSSSSTDYPTDITRMHVARSPQRDACMCGFVRSQDAHSSQT